MLVVGNDDRGISPVRAVLHRGDQVSHMLLPVLFGRVARVLVVGPDRLIEAHRRQGVGADGLDEIGLVLQVGGLAGRAVGIVGVVVEGLVVELEQGIRVAGEGV